MTLNDAAVLEAISAKRWLKPDEVGLYIGRHRKTVEKLVREGKLPSFRQGGCVWIDKADVDAYIEAGRVG